MYIKNYLSFLIANVLATRSDDVDGVNSRRAGTEIEKSHIPGPGVQEYAVRPSVNTSFSVRIYFPSALCQVKVVAKHFQCELETASLLAVSPHYSALTVFFHFVYF